MRRTVLVSLLATLACITSTDAAAAAAQSDAIVLEGIFHRHHRHVPTDLRDALAAERKENKDAQHAADALRRRAEATERDIAMTREGGAARQKENAAANLRSAQNALKIAQAVDELGGHDLAKLFDNIGHHQMQFAKQELSGARDQETAVLDSEQKIHDAHTHSAPAAPSHPVLELHQKIDAETRKKIDKNVEASNAKKVDDMHDSLEAAMDMMRRTSEELQEHMRVEIEGLDSYGLADKKSTDEKSIQQHYVIAVPRREAPKTTTTTKKATTKKKTTHHLVEESAVPRREAPKTTTTRKPTTRKPTTKKATGHHLLEEHSGAALVTTTTKPTTRRHFRAQQAAVLADTTTGNGNAAVSTTDTRRETETEEVLMDALKDFDSAVKQVEDLAASIDAVPRREAPKTTTTTKATTKKKTTHHLLEEKGGVRLVSTTTKPTTRRHFRAQQQRTVQEADVPVVVESSAANSGVWVDMGSVRFYTPVDTVATMMTDAQESIKLYGGDKWSGVSFLQVSSTDTETETENDATDANDDPFVKAYRSGTLDLSMLSSALPDAQAQQTGVQQQSSEVAALQQEIYSAHDPAEAVTKVPAVSNAAVSNAAVSAPAVSQVAAGKIVQSQEAVRGGVVQRGTVPYAAQMAMDTAGVSAPPAPPTQNIAVSATPVTPVGQLQQSAAHTLTHTPPSSAQAKQVQQHLMDGLPPLPGELSEFDHMSIPEIAPPAPPPQLAKILASAAQQKATVAAPPAAPSPPTPPQRVLSQQEILYNEFNKGSWNQPTDERYGVLDLTSSHPTVHGGFQGKAVADYEAGKLGGLNGGLAGAMAMLNNGGDMPASPVAALPSGGGGMGGGVGGHRAAMGGLMAKLKALSGK